jgi:cysteine desulfurase
MFNFFKKQNRNIYLDYAAATPVREEVIKEMNKSFGFFANPGSIHQDGLLAKKILKEKRDLIAKSLNSRADEIIFTSTATESDNLAIRGSVMAFKEKNPSVLPHIITSKIEHAGVLEVCKALENEGLAEVSYINADEKGKIDMKSFKESLKENTILVSFIHANNEIGTIQDIKEISKSIRHFKKYTKGDHLAVYPLLHTDTSQSFSFFDMQMNSFPVDLMTFNSSKIYGPKGVALLYVRKGVPIKPILFGGSQEIGLRPGTEDLASISGFAKAVELASLERKEESARLSDLQKYFFTKAEEKFGDKLRINGYLEDRAPNNINITIKNFESELLVLELDAKGISVSSKSACNESAGDESSVISELYPNEDARIGGVRISLGKYTKKSDLDYLIQSIEQILEKYKNFPKQTV